jgi:hypothetical protein
MLYAHVEGGVVDYAGTLPKVWQNVSGLDKADDVTLKSLGWIPLQTVDLDFAEGEVPDGFETVIKDDLVTITTKKRTLTPGELHDYRLRKWEEEMAASDAVIPRWAEDIIDALDNPTRNRIAKETRDKIDAKKATRGSKP